MEFRRAPHLLLHWQENQLVLHNYAVRRTLPAHALVIDVLRQFDTWRPLGQYLDTVPAAARDSVRRLVRELHRQRLLWRRDEPLTPAERAMDAWDQWNPSAGFFHSASKDVRFIDIDTHLGRLAEQASTWSMPSPLKEYPRARRVRLPKPQTRGAFPRVLRARRTWRRFADAPLDLEALSTMLHFSVGVQQWATAEGEGPIALKTSPSGGARHPIEAYVAARNVRSLPPGSITTRPARMRSSGLAARGTCLGSTRSCRRSGGTGTPRRWSCSRRCSSERGGATTAPVRIVQCCSKPVTSARPSA